MKQVGVILILGLLSLVLGGLASGAAAQETPELASLNIALWPEFDRPEMLVIYQGALAPGTPLPAAVEIRIPARVGRPTAMAFLSETGERLNQQYTTRVEGEALVVSFGLTSLGFQLEYYDELPVSAEGQREYAFAYTADYAVTGLSIELQVPRTAADLVVEPQAGASQTGSDGLVYYHIDVGPVEAGETMGWTFRYAKDDDELTNPAPSQPAAQPTVPAGTGGAGDGGNSTVLTFVVAFVALLGVGTVAFWLGRSTRPAAREAPFEAGRQGLESSGQREALDATFCYKCGSELRPDADFCHKCGTPVRS
jgi:hypothetical protein